MKLDQLDQREIFEMIDKNPSLLNEIKDKDDITVFFLRVAFDPNMALNVSINLPYTPADRTGKRMAYPGGIKREAMIFERSYMDGNRGDNGVGTEPVLDKSFVRLLEKYEEADANVLNAIKNQNLTSIYPNITGELLYDCGIIPEKYEADDSQTPDATPQPTNKFNVEEPENPHSVIADPTPFANEVDKQSFIDDVESYYIPRSDDTIPVKFDPTTGNKLELQYTQDELKAMCADDPTLIRNIDGWWISLLNDELCFHSDFSVQGAFEAFNQDNDEPVSHSLLAVYFREDKTIDIKVLTVDDISTEITPTVSDIPETKKPRGRPKGSKGKKKAKKPKAKSQA